MRVCSSGIVMSPERMPASTCAKRTPGLVRRPRARERRVRVAEDDDGVRLLALERFGDPGQHRVHVSRVRLEPVGGLREPELFEEHVRELAVVVLPRVQDDLLHTRLAQRDGQRTGLDELRAVAHDGEDLHAASTSARAAQARARTSNGASGRRSWQSLRSWVRPSSPRPVK